MKILQGACTRFMAVAVVFGTVAGIGTASAGDFVIQGTAGFVTSTGQVGDMLIGNGVVFSGRAFACVSEQISVGGGAHLALHGGRSFAQAPEIDMTDAGVRFSFDGGAIIYLLKKPSQVRPYLGGFAGWGFLTWAYADAVKSVPPYLDSDSIGFFYMAPEAGLSFEVSDSVALTMGARMLIALYPDKTREDYLWDLDGGHFFEVHGGLSLSL